MDIFGGHHKIGLYLFRCHFCAFLGLFLMSRCKMRDVFGVVKVQIFFGCLEFMIFFGGEL